MSAYGRRQRTAPVVVRVIPSELVTIVVVAVVIAVVGIVTVVATVSVATTVTITSARLTSVVRLASVIGLASTVGFASIIGLDTVRLANPVAPAIGANRGSAVERSATVVIASHIDATVVAVTNGA